MNKNRTAEEIDNFLNEKGKPSNLGCSEADLEKLIALCEEKYPEKGICTVKNWSVVDIEFDDESKAQFHAKGLYPIVLHTHYVMWDKNQRWHQGSFATSSLLVSMEESCFFVTKNTVYLLVGPGCHKLISPEMQCAIQVGLQIQNIIFSYSKDQKQQSQQTLCMGYFDELEMELQRTL